jgi:hypothetical protein
MQKYDLSTCSSFNGTDRFGGNNKLSLGSNPKVDDVTLIVFVLVPISTNTKKRWFILEICKPRQLELVNLFVNSNQLHVFLDLLLCELLHCLPPLFLVGMFIPQSLILYLEQCVVHQQFFKFFQLVMHFDKWDLGWFTQLYICHLQLPLLILYSSIKCLGFLFILKVNKY